MAYDLWFTVCGCLIVFPCLWFRVYGLWFMVYGLWFSVFVFVFLVLCFRFCDFGFILIVPGSLVGLTHLQLDGRATEREG